MSRVPADTVLLRFAVAAVLALPLAGCGGDDAETASTPVAPVASTAAPTTAPDAADPGATTDGTGGTTVAPVETGSKAKEATVEDFEKTKKAAEKAAKGASPVEQSNDDLAAQMKRSFDALKAAGLAPGKPLASGEDNGALTVKETTIAFFPSPSKAAAAEAALETNFKGSPQKVKVARKANRLFVLALPADPTPAQLETYNKVRKVVNGAA